MSIQRKSLIFAALSAVVSLGVTAIPSHADTGSKSGTRFISTDQDRRTFATPSDLRVGAGHSHATVETVDGAHGEFKASNFAKLATLSGTKLSYHGGTSGVVTGTPKVYIVFWGNDWGTQTVGSSTVTFSNDPSGMAPYLENFLAGLGTNGEKWSSVMTQYCQTSVSVPVSNGATTCPTNAVRAGAPSSAGAFNLSGIMYDNLAPNPTSSTTPSTAQILLDEANLASEATKAANYFGNTNASLNANAQYIIVSPSGKHPDGFNSPAANWCAWHNSSISSSLGTVAYTNLPYLPNMGASCGAGYVAGAPSPALQGVSIVEGHEYAETISDMNTGTGWYDNTTGGENGDLCSWSTGANATGVINTSTGTFAMQGSWSNASAGCAMTSLFPAVSSVTPSPANIGQALTVSGTNLTGAFLVTFSSSANTTLTAVPTGVSATGLTVVVPTGAVTGPLIITTPGGTVLTSSLTVNSPPVNQATLRIANTVATGTVGTPIVLTTSGGSGTGAVSYSVTGTNCSIANTNQLNATSATTCTVTATKAASAGFLVATSATKAFTFAAAPVAQSPLVISNTPLSNPKGTVVGLTTTGGTGTGAVTFAVTGAGCTYSAGAKTLTVSARTSVGTAVQCVVTATKAASTGYLAISSSPVTFSFN